MEEHQSPPIVMDTNVLVAGACRNELSLAYKLLLGVLEERLPIILTELIVLEYLDVLARPTVHKENAMATLSLRMRDDLKQKAQQLAKEQGVSLNGFINATLAATIAPQETLHKRILKFMRKTGRGKEPSVEEIERAMRG